MEKSQLLEYIWNEKREKIVRNDVYPLGISICLDEAFFTWHDVIYGILNLIRKNPAKGLEWSENWGRTTIWVHPIKGFSFRFTLDESIEEKLGVFVSTVEGFDPVSRLTPAQNVGIFKAILNLKSVSLEGALLQVERMVDEVVWCRFLEIKGKQFFPDRVTAYATAVEDVWQNGLMLEYVSEEVILEMKKLNMDLPVRIYGDVLGKRKVPAIIGAVCLPKYEGKALIQNVSAIRDSCLKRQECDATVIHSGSPRKLCNNFSSVGCGIALAKEIHAGHLLLVSYADLIKRCVSPGSSLFLESNDTGERMAGLIATIAEDKNVDPASVIKLMQNGEFEPDEINSYYRQRQSRGPGFDRAWKILVRENPKEMLSTMEKFNQSILRHCGLSNLSILSDSLSLGAMRQKTDSIAHAGLPEHGFCFVKFLAGSHRKMIVTKKRGLPTASLNRAAFVERAIGQNDNSEFVFVDADTSVTDAAELLGLSESAHVVQIEGATLGFEMSMASGTQGEAISARDLYKKFEDAFPGSSLEFMQTLRYFILSRSMTAPSYKSNDAARPNLRGLSFFDYKDNDAFVADVFKSHVDLRYFRKSVENAINRIGSVKTNSVDRGNAAFSDRGVERDFLAMVGRMNYLKTAKSAVDLFPKPLILAVDPAFRRYLDLGRRALVLQNEDGQNQFIVELMTAFCAGRQTLSEVNEHLIGMGIIMRPVCGRADEKVRPFFVGNLLDRGYGQKDIINFGPLYAKGEYCLIRKRCFYFETLQTAIEVGSRINAIDPTLSNEIATALESYLEILFGREITKCR